MMKNKRKKIIITLWGALQYAFALLGALLADGFMSEGLFFTATVVFICALGCLSIAFKIDGVFKKW